MRYNYPLDEKGQKTPKGHEIPIPKRSDVFRDLKKVAKSKRSTSNSPRPSLSSFYIWRECMGVEPTRDGITAPQRF